MTDEEFDKSMHSLITKALPILKEKGPFKMVNPMGGDDLIIDHDSMEEMLNEMSAMVRASRAMSGVK